MTNRRVALSPSRANDYKQCPLRYRYRAIDRLPEEKTIPQVRGNLVHACLEDLHSWEKAERTYPNAVKRIKPNWEDMCGADPELKELVPEEATYKFFVECRTLLRGYFEMENPQGFDAHAVEMQVETTLPNGVPVRGFIDRVDVAPTGEVRVIDYKTGKKPSPRFADEALFQMRFYALVYWRLFDVIPHQLRLMYLKVNDDLKLAPSKEELEFFERDLADLWSKITHDGVTGSFRTNKTPLCGWCSFQEICPEFGGTPLPYPGWPDDSANTDDSANAEATEPAN